jgi:hypothetical protein
MSACGDKSALRGRIALPGLKMWARCPRLLEKEVSRKMRDTASRMLALPIEEVTFFMGGQSRTLF